MSPEAALSRKALYLPFAALLAGFWGMGCAQTPGPGLVRGEGEIVVLIAGGGLGFGGAQRREVLAGVAAAQFGVGGDG